MKAYLGLRWFLEAYIVDLDDSVRVPTDLVHLVIAADVDDASCSAVDGRAGMLLERVRDLRYVLVLCPRMKVGEQASQLVGCLVSRKSFGLPVLAVAVYLFSLLLAQTTSLTVLVVELLPAERDAAITVWLLRRVPDQIAELGVHVQCCHVVGEILRFRRPERRGLVRTGGVATRSQAPTGALFGHVQSVLEGVLLLLIRARLQHERRSGIAHDPGVGIDDAGPAAYSLLLG